MKSSGGRLQPSNGCPGRVRAAVELHGVERDRRGRGRGDLQVRSFVGPSHFDPRAADHCIYCPLFLALTIASTFSRARSNTHVPVDGSLPLRSHVREPCLVEVCFVSPYARGVISEDEINVTQSENNSSTALTLTAPRSSSARLKLREALCRSMPSIFSRNAKCTAAEARRMRCYHR